MWLYIVIILILITGWNPVLATDTSSDSLSFSVDLQEIVISAQGGTAPIPFKRAGTIDEYLENSGKVSLVRRGNYAWEPSINSMSTERISVTIEGMKIFHACTDRMDPVTSYVETVNLSKINVGSGFDASPHATNSIGGSLDLRLNKAGFCTDGWQGNVIFGYESNGNSPVYGSDFSYANTRFYFNSGLFHRHSGSYRAGGDEKIEFSQFTKNNFFTNLGYALAPGKSLESTFIYDRASDVGYPALAMDVEKAEGGIASLSYTVVDPIRYFYKWENKIYYNQIIHIMDDTKRPDVKMHMDMPGKSRTGGAYSTLNGQTGAHFYSVNWDTYYNQSYAEMTMYPNVPNELPMYMLTWGDIRTWNTGLFVADEYSFNEHHGVRLSAKGSFQRDGTASDFGWNTLQSYYPGMDRYQQRFTGKVAAQYQYKNRSWKAVWNTGYGSRAPSVSEAYGFYLFNTFDSYDYLGNPHLKQESALEMGGSLAWKNDPFEVQGEVSYFYFTNYIIGRPDFGLSYMTPGASGVKVYRNEPHACLWNASLSLQYQWTPLFLWKGKVSFARGQDNEGGNLPMIPPFGYETSLNFKRQRVVAEVGIQGAARQVNYAPQFGESEKKDYLIIHLSVGYRFRIDKVRFQVGAGVENLTDTRYSTYADWNNIARKGRNFFVNLGISL